MIEDVNVIILAAGKGTRMKSKIHKVMHKALHKTLIDWVLDSVKDFSKDNIYTVVGFEKDQLEDHLKNISKIIVEDQQLGTADAVKAVKTELQNKDGVTIVLNGDSPLLTDNTINKLIEFHVNNDSPLTLLTADLKDPFGYGRIVSDKNGNFLKIVEQKDANKDELSIKEVNSGVYCFNNKLLFKYIDEIKNNNSQKEYYLTDIIEIFRKNNFNPLSFKIEDSNEIMGVNDLFALSKVSKILQNRINNSHLYNGVQIIDPNNTYIDPSVKIGSDTIIEPNVQIIGNSIIGNNCHIGQNSEIRDSIIHDNVTVTSSLLESSEMFDNSNIGPDSHLRPKSSIGENVHIGNFCEIKNAKIGKDTKVGHLTYIGDASLGEDINVGCGVVFVNYDGIHKNHTTVGSKSFIGSNSNIVAPVEISDHSFIAAGSTITNNVPYHSLAIARSRQVNKENYWDKLPISNSPLWSDKNK